MQGSEHFQIFIHLPYKCDRCGHFAPHVEFWLQKEHELRFALQTEVQTWLGYNTKDLKDQLPVKKPLLQPFFTDGL